MFGSGSFNFCTKLLTKASFALHAELACRKWLERGTTCPGGLNTPKSTAWMSLLSYINPPLDAGQEFGISPENEPEVSILRAYQLLLTGLSVTEVVGRMEEHLLPDNLPDFLISG